MKMQEKKCFEVYKEKKKKVKRCIYPSKKEVSGWWTGFRDCVIWLLRVMLCLKTRVKEEGNNVAIIEVLSC